jgi:hypothetical protein
MPPIVVIVYRAPRVAPEPSAKQGGQKDPAKRGTLKLFSYSRTTGGKSVGILRITVRPLKDVIDRHSRGVTVIGVGVVLAASLLWQSGAWGLSAAWSVVPSPNPSPYSNGLSGVSCVSPQNCSAVGVYRDANGDGRTLVESWDGTAWSVIPSPNPSSWDRLEGVSCITPRSCTAVGSSHFGENTLVESWDGTTWSVVPSPNPSFSSSLGGVSCVTPRSCTSVGSSSNDPDHGLWNTLVESWNGTAWSVTPSPNPSPSPSSTNFLYGVSCVSATRCTAVGSYFNSSTGFNTLVESWDGITWSVIPSPNPSSSSSDGLGGVSCISGTSCTAVGGYYDSSRQASDTLVESS